MKHNPYTFRAWLKQFRWAPCAIWDLATDSFDVWSEWQWNTPASFKSYLEDCNASMNAEVAADKAYDSYFQYLELFRLPEHELNKYYNLD